MRSRFLIAALAIVAFPWPTVPAAAVDPTTLPDSKRTEAGLYLAAEEVPGFLAAAGGRVLFLDVRAPAEVMFVGVAPAIDANVPILLGPTATFDDAKGAFKLEANPDFAAEAERRLAAKGLSKDDPVVVMCRSGDRSALAARTLAKAGFTRVWSVVDGFEGDVAKDGPEAGHRVVNGWKNRGLPWGYRLDRAKMYRTGG
jgi:rhodanese-related sulfurtransferase